MKNVYLSQSVVDAAKSFKRCPPEVLGVDMRSVELFEKMNPVLSDGHRCNIITRLLDPTVPDEVRSVLSQFVQKGGNVQDINNVSDEELVNTLPSRYMQSEPQLDDVRAELVQYAEFVGVGNPAPADPADPAPADPAPAAPANPASANSD